MALPCIATGKTSPIAFSEPCIELEALRDTARTHYPHIRSTLGSPLQVLDTSRPPRSTGSEHFRLVVRSTYSLLNLWEYLNVGRSVLDEPRNFTLNIESLVK